MLKHFDQYLQTGYYPYYKEAGEDYLMRVSEVARFANQVGAVTTLTMPKQGDFMAEEKYLFEVGGSHKTFDQIANLPNSYLAIDDIETGNGNRIPLWMFGCLY